MNKNEKDYYIGKLSGYYLGKLDNDEVKKVEKTFKYFNNNPIMNYIIEQKFKNNKSVRFIEINCEEKISKYSITNYINFFLDQLRYEFK